MKKPKKKDKQFIELLFLNSELQQLGNALVASIEKANWTFLAGLPHPTPHMRAAIEEWKRFIKENHTEVKYE